MEEFELISTLGGSGHLAGLRLMDYRNIRAAGTMPLHSDKKVDIYAGFVVTNVFNDIF